MTIKILLNNYFYKKIENINILTYSFIIIISSIKMFENINQIEKKYNIKYNDEYKPYHQIILNLYNNNETNLDINDKYICNILGHYYKDINDCEQMKKYYGLAIELNNVDSMNNLGHYYYEIKEYEKMKKYYGLAIELNDSKAMNILGLYYHSINEYEQMKKYWLMAIELNNSNAMNNLGYYYYLIKEYEKMKKYYDLAIELNDLDAMNDLEIYYGSNKLKFYNFLINSKSSELINNKIIGLKNDKVVNNYINKIKLYSEINFIKECCICSNIKLNITFECAHYVCTDCYVEVDKCPICRQIVNK